MAATGEQQSSTMPPNSAAADQAIPTLELEWRRPWMYRKQLVAIFNPARYSIIEASTKAGKTIGALTWLLEQAMLGGKEGQNYWWVAPVSGQAEIAFRRLKLGLDADIFFSTRSPMKVTLANGAAIWFKSADKPDSLYGDDVFAAVMDEASRAKEAAWHAVRSTLTFTKGAIRIIGNVKGRKNWFYRLARRAEHTDNPAVLQYHKIIAADAVAAGVLTAEEVADAKAMLPELAFRELYLAEATDDGANPFGMDAIRDCIKPGLSPLPVVAWGWDLAKSQNWTVGIGLDRNGDVAKYRRFQKPWNLTMDIILHETGFAPALVDSTGVGDPIVEKLQTEPGTNFIGYKFTSPSKQQLMEGLALGIQRRELGYPDGDIRYELEQFEFQYTRNGVVYRAPEGMHDDCVCSLALAKMCKEQNRGIELWERLAG
jgi:hypothetical protein